MMLEYGYSFTKHYTGEEGDMGFYEFLSAWFASIYHRKKCGAYYGKFRKYCLVCGRENKLFDEEKFKNQYSLTLIQMQERECDIDHQSAMRVMHQFQKMPFCEFCGANLSLIQ